MHENASQFVRRLYMALVLQGAAYSALFLLCQLS